MLKCLKYDYNVNEFVREWFRINEMCVEFLGQTPNQYWIFRIKPFCNISDYESNAYHSYIWKYRKNSQNKLKKILMDELEELLG